MPIRLPRLFDKWETQPKLLERYWDEAMNSIEKTLNAILEIPIIKQGLQDVQDDVAGLTDQVHTAQDTADTALAAANAAQSSADSKQPLDATLTALAGLDTSVGLVEQTGTDIFTKRALGVGASTSVLTRADGDTRYATSGTVGLTDGDKGDIVVSSSGTVWNFDSSVITSFAKTYLDDTSALAVRTTLGLIVSSTDNVVPRFDGTTGDFQSSSFSISDVGQLGCVIDAVGGGALFTSFNSTSATTRPLFSVRRARGSQASPSKTLNNDEVGSFTFVTHNGTVFNTNACAAMHAFATQDQDLGIGAKLQFVVGVASATTQQTVAEFINTGAKWFVPLLPNANDLAALGSTTLSWSDVFLATGAVINFNNGNATLTHSSGLLTSSVPVAVPDDAYSATTWDASVNVPTKNAIRDKIESLGVSLSGITTYATDADTTVTPGTTKRVLSLTGTITANRTLTLSTTGAVEGNRYRIVRTGGGAFVWNIGTGPLRTLGTNTWCDVDYDGSAWSLTAYGSL